MSTGLLSNYTVRRPLSDDIPEFLRIAKTYSNNPLVEQFETCAVVESFNGNIKGFGVTRTLLEAVLYCEGSKKDKLASLELLLHQAINDAHSKKFNQIYVFVQDNDKFEKLLIKKYGFDYAKGNCLILEL